MSLFVRACSFAVIWLLVTALSACDSSSHSDEHRIALDPDRPVFPLVEATIDGMWSAMAEGQLSCRDVVQGYLDRIAAYDADPTDAYPDSPALHSVIRVSETALDEADALDEVYFSSGKKVGPLHCVTVLVKDNIDTDDMPTTAGSLVLEDSRPPDDAFIVGNLRAAGAIILGKANLDEWAFLYVGASAVGGQVLNAYDPGKSPGGSSSGSATAVASNFAMVALGTDTGGSVRVPSALAGLIGLRPTLRLVSQDGIVPLAHGQDTAGPMCRTVQDCALVMDALAGYDDGPYSGQRTARSESAPLVADAAAYAAMTQQPDSYADALDGATLSGARIGVVRELFPSGSDAEAYNAVLDLALERMVAAGAVVEDVSIADLDAISDYQSLSSFEFRDDLSEYLASWSSDEDNHPQTASETNLLMQLMEPLSTTSVIFAGYMVTGLTAPLAPAYEDNLDARDAYVIPRVQAALDNTDLDGNALGEPYDVLVYPVIANVNRADAGSGADGNGEAPYLSPYSGFPEMSMPVAFVLDEGYSDYEQPVALDMIARPFDEETLIRIGYAWQQYAQVRQAPTITPEL